MLTSMLVYVKYCICQRLLNEGSACTYVVVMHVSASCLYVHLVMDIFISLHLQRLGVIDFVAASCSFKAFLDSHPATSSGGLIY